MLYWFTLMFTMLVWWYVVTSWKLCPGLTAEMREGAVAASAETASCHCTHLTLWPHNLTLEQEMMEPLQDVTTVFSLYLLLQI